MSIPSTSPLECLYCQQSAERPIGPEPDKRRAGKCPECGGPHHVWCWHVHGGCSRLNCLYNPKTRNHAPIPYEPGRIHELFAIEQAPETPGAPSDRWTAFERFENEYKSGSHRRIAAAWNEELFDHFQPADTYRADVATANRCVQTLERLVAEYRRQHWQSVMDIYETSREHFDACSDFRESFQNHVAEARRQLARALKERVQRVLDRADDEELERIVAGGGGSKTGAALDTLQQQELLTPGERARIRQALERLAIIRQVVRDLGNLNTQAQAVALYDEKQPELRLADSQALTTQDRVALYEARRAQTRDALRSAIVKREDNEILTAAGKALAAGWSLRDATLDLVREAGERKAARDRLTKAVGEPELLVAYDDELWSEEAPGPQEAVEAARRRFKPLLALQRAIKRNNLRAVARLISDPSTARELVPRLSAAEQAVVARTQSALESLTELRELIAQQPRTLETLRQIVTLAGADREHTLEALLSPYERQELHKATLMFQALDELRRLEQAPDMPYVKLAIARTYHQARAGGMVLPEGLNWGKIRAALAFEEKWTALARALERGDEHGIFRAWNPTLLHDAFDLLSERDQQKLLQALDNARRGTGDSQRLALARGEDTRAANSSHES